MYITTEVIITFDPIKECDAISKFMADNDMSKWTEYPCTVGITFKKKDSFSVDMRGDDHEND